MPGPQYYWKVQIGESMWKYLKYKVLCKWEGILLNRKVKHYHKYSKLQVCLGILWYLFKIFRKIYGWFVIHNLKVWGQKSSENAVPQRFPVSKIFAVLN